MGNKKLVGAVVLLCVGSVIGQTPSEFEKKYGKPLVTYQVSEHIWMTPEYTTDGQVCTIRLHPRRFSTSTNYISPHLPFHELKKILNQLVPLQTRGAKMKPFDSGAAGGGADWMSYAYENVRFSFVASFRPEPQSWKKKREYVLSIKPEQVPAQSVNPTDLAPSDNDFSSSEHMSTEIVTISWSGRRCAKQ